MRTLLTKRRATDAQDLVDLLGECHERIRRFVALAREAAARRDVAADQISQACQDVERYFTQALPLHVADEEQSLEPRLRRLSPTLDAALDDVTRQHHEHEPALSRLLRATRVLRDHPHDGEARHELAVAALAIEALFEEHLRLEERVVFPAIRELLSPETQRAIVDELRARRLVRP